MFIGKYTQHTIKIHTANNVFLYYSDVEFLGKVKLATTHTFAILSAITTNIYTGTYFNWNKFGSIVKPHNDHY